MHGLLLLHAFDAEGAVRDAWLVVEEVETRLCKERESVCV
jgi:hypothetical protein